VKNLRPKSLKLRPAKASECLDANGVSLGVGRKVKSVPLYATDGTIVRGVVKAALMHGSAGLVEVEHRSGDRKGQVWRSASKLWVAV
jgi:hypothetical protein